MNSEQKIMDHQKDQSNSISVSRRDFMAKSALLGITAGVVGLNHAQEMAVAKEGAGKLKLAGASGFKPLEVNNPMARWKKPQSLEFVTGATERFSFQNWQSGNDDSVYYNLNIPSFFKSRVVAPPAEFSVLDRAIKPDLLNLTFTAHDGKTTPPLKDYLVGPRQYRR